MVKILKVHNKSHIFLFASLVSQTIAELKTHSEEAKTSALAVVAPTAT